MSKFIKLTTEHINECHAALDEILSGAKLFDGRVSLTKNFECKDRKAVVYFEPIAWDKMRALIDGFDKEVAWHGLARRGEDETRDEYIIYDILVYPQTVTGATVNTDQEKYSMWLMEQPDDVFNYIRMQGHSHVNMHTSPSGVDLTHQEKILEQLGDEDFYIFMIWNKRGEKNVKIYDLKKNILFENLDVQVSVIRDECLIPFMIEAKTLVQERVYTPATYQYPGTAAGNSYSNPKAQSNPNPNSPPKTSEVNTPRKDIPVIPAASKGTADDSKKTVKNEKDDERISVL